MDTDKGNLVYMWYGPRDLLLSIIRNGFKKSSYDRIHASEVKYYPGNGSPAHGSYNLFHPTSNMFHLIYDGDYNTLDFIAAIIAYCLVEDIMLPRAMGGGGAPRIAKRIPIIILSTDNEISPALAPYVQLVDATTLIDP